MKKKSLLLIAPLILGALTGCRKTVSYKVYFNLNYDECPEGESYSVEEGKTVGKPSDPTREGYRFDGWRVESSYTSSLYDFATPVTKTFTVFASWVEQVTITFDPQNGDQVWSQTTDKSGIVTKPTDDPTYGQNLFYGWCITKEPNKDKIFDFTQPITENTTVYGTWTKGVSIQHNPTSLVIGNSYSFTAKELGNVTTTSTYNFKTEANEVLDITAEGVVTLKKEGTAKIEINDVSYGKAKDTLDVTVIASPSEEVYVKYASFSDITESEGGPTVAFGTNINYGDDAGPLPEKLIIPSSHKPTDEGEALPVIKVGQFVKWGEGGVIHNNTVKSIVIPDSVKEITGWCFAHFETLTDVQLGNGLETIGGFAFFENKIKGDNNNAFHIPASVTKIEGAAFSFSGGTPEGAFSKVIFEDEESLWKITYDDSGEQIIHESYNPRENPEEAASLLRSYQTKSGGWVNPTWEKVVK